MKNILLIGTVMLSIFSTNNVDEAGSYDVVKISSGEEVVKDDNDEKTDEETTSSNYATPQSGTNGTVVENVDQNNKEYEINENEASKRQFVTITTKSGKEFHLIINHDKQGDNVQFLTEVSEQDLLNLVEVPKEETRVIEVEEKEEETKPVVKEDVKTEEGSNTFLYLMLFIVVAGVGYYLKILKPKKSNGKSEFDEDEEIENDECDSYVSKEWEEFEE